MSKKASDKQDLLLMSLSANVQLLRTVHTSSTSNKIKISTSNTSN